VHRNGGKDSNEEIFLDDFSVCDAFDVFKGFCKISTDKNISLRKGRTLMNGGSELTGIGGHYRRRLYMGGFILVLLIFGVSCANLSLPRGDGALSPKQTRSSSGPSGTQPDFDGDGLSDQIILSTGSFSPNIELYLSRTSEPVVLPISTMASGEGSLSAQDVDGDGDIDLLWQRSLPSRTVIVWLNDGVGRFECLCEPAAHERGFALRGLGVYASHARRPDSASSSERIPAPGDALTARWRFYTATVRGSRSSELLEPVSCLNRLLSIRSPPSLSG